MDLRTRILLGYGYLVSLVVISALAAALGFHSLGNRLSEVLEENFASVRWSTEMIEALERQDSALLAALLGDDGSERALAESERTFLDALGKARSNVTEDREVDIIDQVEQEYRAYREARNRLLAEPRDRPLAAYQAEAFPLFDAVKRSVVELLDVNHKAMVKADEAARAAATRNAAGHGLVVVVALATFAWLSRALRREVLVRLAELKSVAQAMAAGDLGRRADATRSDELGLLAAQLNELLDGDAELRGRMAARLAGAHDLVLGLLKSSGEPAVLLAGDGRLVASTLPDADVAVVEQAWRELRAGKPPDELPVEFNELVTGSRSVGWLATRRQQERVG
jgi:HAMP domain-containing protein